MGDQIMKLNYVINDLLIVSWFFIVIIFIVRPREFEWNIIIHFMDMMNGILESTFLLTVWDKPGREVLRLKT